MFQSRIDLMKACKKPENNNICFKMNSGDGWISCFVAKNRKPKYVHSINPKGEIVYL